MKIYNIAIMGTGNIAAKMAHTLKNMNGVNCYAVGSRNINRAKQFSDMYGFEKSYGSYEELSSDNNVDLVYIATPHSEHFSEAKLCITNGKAVLIEKAFTVNARQAIELLKISKEKNIFVTEAIWTRYMPFFSKIKEVINSGIIGEPTMLTANLGYDIDNISRLTDPNLAGGALLDVGVYVLNFACTIFGTEYKNIVSTCTYTKTGVDEQDSITMIYEDGKMAVLNCSMLSVSDRKGIIYGDKGFIIIENINNFESISVFDNSYQRIAYYERANQITGYEYEVYSSLKAIENGKIECEEMPHNEIVKLMEIMDKLRKTWGIVYPCE